MNKHSHTALLWIVAAGFFMQALDTTIVNTALPNMAVAFHVSALDMRPVVVAYALVMAMLTPASGWLADKFGTRRVYFTAILIFVLGSLFCALAHRLDELVIARVIQGIGGSMLMPIGRLALLRSVSSEEYIGALAFVSIAGQLGPMLGPVLGGWFVEAISWHWIFLINLPIGALGLYAVHRFLPAGSPAEIHPFDFVGFTLLSVSMASVSLALDCPVDTHRTIISSALFAVFLLTVGLYIVHAQRRRGPLFELALFRERNFSVGLVGNLVARVGSSALPFLLPLLLQVQLGYTPLQSGLFMLPIALVGTVAKRWVTPLIQRYGYETFLLVNTLIVGASIASCALISTHWPLALAVIQLAIFGASNSMQFAAMNSVTLKGLTPAQAGSGNSLFSMIQMLAMSLGVTIGGSLVGVFAHLFGTTAVGYRLAFACVGTITLLSAGIFRYLDAPRVRPMRAPEPVRS
ncbi:DHA2 family efflux MFS transporter permease subunit [Pararobbsia silviterrae]|uniref:DHA2 family efflux MFS transporter permease subunit n=1 Tax=Pararobbsia silviterrae TaxID=1792498 RepID=A0A494XYR9_9BURK|nr:DHA2 family efflux MFS transporter permease subunit [Pararobbsia silviterrae]RKP55704.1 DHA2 family efflux MFS transporter permease subunit [Pararobbsia silviterrae]